MPAAAKLDWAHRQCRASENIYMLFLMHSIRLKHAQLAHTNQSNFTAAFESYADATTDKDSAGLDPKLDQGMLAWTHILARVVGGLRDSPRLADWIP